MPLHTGFDRGAVHEGPGQFHPLSCCDRLWFWTFRFTQLSLLRERAALRVLFFLIDDQDTASCDIRSDLSLVSGFILQRVRDVIDSPSYQPMIDGIADKISGGLKLQFFKQSSSIGTDSLDAQLQSFCDL